MRAQLPTCIAFVLLARLSAAQTPEGTSPTWTPRWYGGIGLTKGIYQSYDSYFKPSLSPAITAGIRLGPRVAVEVSVIYTHKEEENNYLSSSTFYDTSTQQNIYAQVATHNRERLLVVPLLLRASLTKATNQHVYFDLLGGVTVAYIGVSSKFTAKNNSQYTVYEYQSDVPTTEGYLSLGAGCRYVVSPRFEVVGDALL